jgi:hypothetical protein
MELKTQIMIINYIRSKLNMMEGAHLAAFQMEKQRRQHTKSTPFPGLKIRSITNMLFRRRVFAARK